MKQTIISILILILTLTGLTQCSKKAAVAPDRDAETRITSEKPRTAEATPVAPKTTTTPGALQSDPHETATALPKSYQLTDIYFDFDRYELKPEARVTLARHAQYLTEKPNNMVVIEGHCDEWGTIEYNLALGERRANSVFKYLVDFGVPASRLETISYGKERPVDPQRTPEAWAKNRRAAFVINKK